jgi:NAD(P) transhydrogenase subunit alpha
MKLFCPSELPADPRIAVDPDSIRKLTGLGVEVLVPPGLGAACAIPDKSLEAAGARLLPEGAVKDQAITVRVNPPDLETIAQLPQNSLHVSFLDPFNRKDLVAAFASAGVNAVSMEMIPRTTLAQKMDALSSQANLAGYAAVIRATDRLKRILPMMMTPAGTLSPARVFIIGVGVAGLQAIATARRLGARVEAFDTRPVVEEQVKSLGAKFVKIDLGDTGQTSQGYAKELTAEQIELQRQGMAKVCAQSDIVITTAKLFGRPAPTLLTAEMVAGMKPGSVVVDLAAESGGNVEGTVLDEETTTSNGVTLIGTRKLEATIPVHASQMFAANIAAFIEHFWDAEKGCFEYRREDPILKGCLITSGGEILDDRFKS